MLDAIVTLLEWLVIGITCVGLFLFGWIAILWAVFTDMPISSEDAFAFRVTLYLYTGALVTYVLFGLYHRSNPKDIPPTLKIIAAFLKFPDIEATRKADNFDDIDLKEMANVARDRHENGSWEPAWIKEHRAHKHRQAAQDLARDTEALKAEAEMHEAARKYQQAKARAEAMKKRRDT